MKYRIKLTKNALKDIHKLRAAGLDKKLNKIKAIIILNPTSAPAKKLSGNLKGFYSIRINLQHRFVYKVYEDEKVIKVISLWSHYEE